MDASSPSDLSTKTISLLKAAACLALVAFAALPADAVARDDRWTEAFQASPATYVVGPEIQSRAGASMVTPVDGTLRFTLYVAVGGGAVRIRLSNEDGNQPIRIGAASVALAGQQPGTTRGDILPLTFHGQTSFTIPAGAPAESDPVTLTTEAMERLVVSIYTTEGAALHVLGGAGMWLAPGDQTSVAALQDGRAARGRPLVSGAAVASSRQRPVVVALGDSITDGLRMTDSELRGYPEHLAQRFAHAPASQRRSVINAGIGGNRVLTTSWGDNALARLDRDVLRIEGVSHIILLEGINDIGMSGQSPFGLGPNVSAEDLIAAYRQIIARAHTRGIRVLGGTLLPFGDCFYYSASKEDVRQAVNAWIRTAGEFDGVIDFDVAMRDPAHPLKLRAEFDSGDHLHPSEAGYRAMAEAIDLSLFR